MEDLPTWLRPGVIVDGKYEMVRLIGRGGMGVVFEARHTTLGERVAIKVLLATALRSAESIARFLREARAAFAVRDEHVARVLDAGTGPSGDPYLVMELLEGSDLAEVLRARGPLPVAEAVEYAAQACAALSAAHAQAIVHRDVKPANLFLSRTSSGAPLVKVLDFGIAKADDTTGPGLTETSTGIGTLPYMSPEQVKASRDVDARADVYSLGATLHELLTGRRLFEAPSPAELIVSILHAEPTPLRVFRPDAPAALEAVILRATRKAREERFASAEGLAAAARHALRAPAPNVGAPMAPWSAGAPPLPSALASTAGPQQLAPHPVHPANVYPPPPHQPSTYNAVHHPAQGQQLGFLGYRQPPAYGHGRPVLPPARGGGIALITSGGVITTGGVVTFLATAAGLVNGSEIGTAIAIGVAACAVGGPMFVAGLSRLRR